MEYIKIPPRPKMGESLRHMGYTTIYALADILDNSLDAEAEKVNIYASSSGTQKEPVSVIDIFDNGSGMTGPEIEEALTYGANTNKSAHALGCFGLGLKTAGTSIGRRIIVLSRTVGGVLECRVYDLDANVQQGDFVVAKRSPTAEEAARFNEELGASSGTWISLRKIDQEEYKNVKTLLSALKSERNLRLIFRKFLASKKCSISVNGTELVEFGYDYVDGIDILAGPIPFRLKDGTDLGSVKIISTADTTFTGKHGSSRPQGLVVVRNNRDITPKVSWKGILTNHWEYTGVYVIWEATAQQFDSLMGTTVMKNDWNLPQNVGDALKNLINPHMMSYKKQREKIRAEKSNSDSTVAEDVIKSYGNNLNNNMNITPKPKIRNVAKVNPPTRKAKSPQSSNTKKDNSPGSRSFKQLTLGADAWVFDSQPNVGAGRYYVWQAQEKQRGGIRYLVTFDSKHPWVEKLFSSDFAENERAMFAVLDQTIGDVYMEMDQDSTEQADSLVHTKSNFLRARANVTTAHDPDPLSMVAK